MISISQFLPGFLSHPLAGILLMVFGAGWMVYLNRTKPAVLYSANGQLICAPNVFISVGRPLVKTLMVSVLVAVVSWYVVYRTVTGPKPRLSLGGIHLAESTNGELGFNVYWQVLGPKAVAGVQTDAHLYLMQTGKRRDNEALINQANKVRELFDLDVTLDRKKEILHGPESLEINQRAYVTAETHPLSPEENKAIVSGDTLVYLYSRAWWGNGESRDACRWVQPPASGSFYSERAEVWHGCESY